MAEQQGLLSLDPEEVFFSDVRLNQGYCQTVTFTNNLKATVEATIRAGSSDRYSVSPTSICLKPGQSATVDVRLRVLRFAQKKKAVEQGQRDIFHVKATYFDQKFFATFFLAPEELGPGTAVDKPQQARSSSAAGAAAGRAAAASAASGGAGSSRGRSSSPPRHAKPRERSLSPRDTVREEMLDRQAEALRDKDELLKVMQSRLEVAKQQARSSLPRVQSPGEADGGGFADLDQAEMHIEHLEAVNAQLEGANTQLRSRNQELGSELQGAQEELAALSDLQSQLQHFSPDVERLVETAVARERALQDARNRKVLELLNNKDEVIQRFEARYAEAHAESRQLQASMQDAYKKLDVSEARVADLIEARAKLRKQLDQKQAEFAAMHAAMQAEIAALKGDEGEFQALPRPRSPPRRPADMDKLAAQLRAELEVSKDALAASRQEIHKLSTSLHTANDWIEVRVQDQSGNEAAKAKDQEIFGLQQQVAELEALLVDEAERHGSGARQPGSAGQAGSGRKGQHGDSLLNVSLDAGIGAAPPGSPSALQRRVHALEAANEKLERALLEANKKRTASSAWTGTAQNGFAGSTAIDTTMDHLRSLLADRDLQIQRLQHELAHAGSSSADEATDLPSDEGALRDSIRSLRRQLADKDALLASNEERLSRLEAVHRVAQETAMASEAQLQQSRSSQAQSDADKEFGKLDAHKARAAAVRLNARVSELTLAEQSARGQLEAAKQELGRVRTAWQAEVAALQQRQKQLKDALQAVVGHTGENTHLAKVIEEAASSAPHGTVSQAAAALDPEVASRPNKAVEDAEVAVAVMQARLLEAEREKREAQQQLADAREAADTERAQLEQAVRRAREEGSVKIASLEDTVRKLSGRSDLHQELARTGGELSTLRRSEARLKSDLVFANERLEEVQRELSMQRSRLAGYEASEHERNIIAEIRKTVAPDRDPAAQAIPAFSLADMSGDPAGQPALIAKLVERAEAAEINASRFQRELEALQRSAASRAAASGAGASAVLSAAQVVEERSAALQRSLVLYESEIKALREEKEVQDLEVARLHAQLAEAAREVAAAQARLVDGERQQHDRSEAAARRGITSNASHWKDIGTAARKQSDAERAAESAQAARQAAEQDLRAAQLEVTRLKAELDAKETLLKRATSQAREDVERATAAAEVAQRECERSTCEAEDRKMQLGVLMETMETLQAGNPGEKEQRIVSLTAQLTAARMKESMLERHSSELRAEAEGHQRQLGMLHAELDKARAAVSEREAQNALDRAAADMLRKEVQGLKTDAKAQAEAVARMGHELDDGRAALEKAEAEMTGLRAALENARSRHFEQLTKERVEASSALRKARTDSFNATASGTATPQPSAGSAKLASGVNELVTLMRSSLSSRRHTQEDVNSRRVSMDDARSDDGMSVGTCASGLAGTDDDVPQRVVQRLKGLIVEAEAQRSHAEADARIAHAEAAEAIRKIRTLEAALEKRTSEWEAALAERETHLVNSARRHMQVAAHAEEKLALQDRRIQALSEQLERANTQLIGLHVMAKHNTSKQTQQKWRVEALQRKLVVAETEIKELEANLAAAVMEAAGTANASNADSVAEAIAARDAGIKAYFEEENVSLKQALQATETRLKSFEDRGLTAEMSGQDHVVAELSAQLASKAHEIYKLQEEALHRRQELASHDLQQQELQAGLANAEAAVKQARIDADRAIEQLRVQLSSDFAAEREHLLKELETANQRNKDAIQQIQKDAAQCQEHSNAELDAVREAAEQQLAARPETHEFAEAIDRASAAEARAQQLEADVGRLHDEIDRLQAAIQRGETELTGLRADAEIRGSALASLEETLGKIERSTERAAGSSSAPLGGVARRVSVSSRSLSGGASSKALNVNGGDLSLGALSRQLVNAKMAEADALRKLRVSARAEVELRQRLAQKEDRITELKETLSTKASQYDDLKRRLTSPEPQDQSQQLSELCNQIADLRIELAKRDAEIDYLEGALAQANAQQVERRPDTPRSEHSELDHMHQELQNKSAKASELRRTLRELQRECAEAAAAARSALGQSSRTIGRATTPPPAASPAMDAEAKDAAQISNLVDQLITRLKEKEASAKRLRVAVKTAQDKHVASQVAAAAQPLEASQRAVIRDLSLKVSNLTRLNNQLKADRERAQERLRTLRASLGSTKIPQLFEPLAPADQALLQLTGPATAATTQPGAPGAVPASGMGSGAGPAASGAATPASSGSAAADFDSMEGLCRLLEHHLNTLEQAQQPVSSMLKAAEPEAPDADAPPAAAAPANAVADKQVLAQELAAATTATAALEAALNERLYAAEKNIEECVVRHRVEVSRLEAALAGADAARAELAAQASRTTVGMTDLRAALAKAAEGEARAEALQKQIDTLRAQSNASRAGLQEEVQALSAALAQEKGERARIVMSLRDTIGGLKQAGDVEGRLKAELIQLHEQLATARAAQEQAEAKASQRRSEAKAAKNKLEALREELNQRIAAAELADHAATLRLSEMQQAYGRLESRLAGMDAKRAELEAAMLARMDTIAAQIAADTQGPPDLVAGVEALERSAHEMDTRFHELEARAEVLGRHKHDCAAVKWESLLRARRYRSALQQVKGELQAATFDKTSVAGEVDKAQAAARAAEAEAQELCRRMEEMQRHHESERQKLAERHAAQLCEVESRIEEERGALRQEALAMAASAAAAAEDRGRAAANIRLCETEQRALKDVTNAHSEQRRLADELDTLRAHFKAYQQVKCQEVAVLEARLRQCLQQRPSQPGTPSLPASPLRIPTDTRAQKRRVPRSQPSLISGGRASARGLENMPADEAGGLDPSAINMGSEVAAAVEAESVMAALREAEFERLQREAAEDMLNAMQESVEKLKQKLKQAQKDAKVARDGSAATAANAMDRPSKEEFDQLKEQTAGLQGTLKAVRAESSRRLAALQALQQQVGPDGTPIPPQALAGEREARESAERALQQAKHAVQRKGQLVADLKKRVSELEEALDKAAQSHSARDAEAAEGRIRSLQATVARKEEAIRDLKAQVDQLTRATLQKAADQDSERLQAATKKLKGDLARKDALLRAAQADLDKVREEATAAMRSAESASKREARAWREAGTDIAIVRKRALAVLDALRALARLALRSVAAMSAAASTASAAQMAPAKPSKAEAPRVWDAVTADAIAKMVDMSPAEVQDVLGATGSRSGESASAEVAHDVAALLLQLESTLTAGVADAAQRFADPEAGGREPGEGSDSGSLRSFTVRAPDQTQWKAACLNRLVEQLEGESRRAEALLANALAHLPNMEGKAAASWVARQASRAQHPGRRSQSDTVSKLEAELRRASKGIEADLGL
ncbi:hypothetical protein WJX72_005629 [[Myrmecia] bisecta]|uniref:MSP domain-containing protein n=1 Tax=[Myrmecia] bisecta TaxID=41462 RepID=A0AAW1Q7G1_9CHLO